MKRLTSNRQPAQTIALAAIMMLAIVGALGLVIDVGLLWITQRELQKTADNAALGGVAVLPNASAAQQQAAWYATTIPFTSRSGVSANETAYSLMSLASCATRAARWA